jgi:hypothetical protein
MIDSPAPPPRKDVPEPQQVGPSAHLTALARLLGRQAAREALKLEGKVGSLPTARGDFDNGTSPSTPQADPSSDAL